MNSFDAINHAMTTLSTGGYSTHDASFGYFESSALQLTATLFMLLGGLPFVLYVKYIHSGKFVFHKDDQVKGFLTIIGVLSTIIIFYLVLNNETKLKSGIVLTLFNVVSVLTTTGYAITDYTLWGHLLQHCFSL